MPLAEQHLSRDRLNFHGSLTSTEIDCLLADKDVRVLQTAEPVDTPTWDLLNARFFNARPEVELRVYGHYRKSCDLTFLSHLGNLRRFAADCLIKASGVEHISRLANLERLSVGIYELESFNFLRDLQSEELTHLSLGATFSKKPSLRVIERFPRLEQLYIEGQRKDIDAIGRLKRLRDLTLRSITVPTLGFLRGLSELRSLDIKLGGTKYLGDLPYVGGIRYLELWQVKGLADLGPLAEITTLQYLYLQALRNVKELPNMSRLSGLRRLYLENMKGLKDLSSLATAPALEELVHASAQGRQPQEYTELLAKGTLKRIFVGFGNARKSAKLDAMMRASSVDEFTPRPFNFI